jgi:ADP-ribosylglycohydrolase
MALLDRLNPGERYTVIRLTSHLAYPRHAGIGNDLHCGVAMYMMPVGAVNAGDPAGAVREAVALAMVQSDSYGVEGAALLASCYARAFSAHATIVSVCGEAADLAREGTRRAVERVLAAVNPDAPLERFIREVREAFLPFCPFEPPGRQGGGPDLTNRNQPSRILALEEPPVALAVLRYGDGDFYKTLKAGVCYGRDCDSIAGMACGLFGAIHGLSAIPADLRMLSDAANKRDFSALAADFAAVAAAIHEKDRQTFALKSRSIGGGGA